MPPIPSVTNANDHTTIVPRKNDHHQNPTSSIVNDDDYECTASCCSLSSLLYCGGCERGDAPSDEEKMSPAKSSTTQEVTTHQQPTEGGKNNLLSKSIMNFNNAENSMLLSPLQSEKSTSSMSSWSLHLTEEVSRLQSENESLKAQLRRCTIKLKEYERRERKRSKQANQKDEDDQDDNSLYDFRHNHTERELQLTDTKDSSEDTIQWTNKKNNRRRRTKNNEVEETIGQRRTGFLTPSRSETSSRHHSRRRGTYRRRRNSIYTHVRSSNGGHNNQHHCEDENNGLGEETSLEMDMDDMDLLFSGFASPLPSKRSITKQLSLRTSPRQRVEVQVVSSKLQSSSTYSQSHSHSHSRQSRSSSLSKSRHNDKQPSTKMSDEFWKQLTMRHAHPPGRNSIYTYNRKNSNDNDDDETTNYANIEACQTPSPQSISTTNTCSSDIDRVNDPKNNALYQRTKQHSSSEVLHMLSQMNLPLPDISVTPSDVQQQLRQNSQREKQMEEQDVGEDGQFDQAQQYHSNHSAFLTSTSTTTSDEELGTTHPTSTSTPIVTSWNLWGIFGNSDIMAEHPHDEMGDNNNHSSEENKHENHLENHYNANSIRPTRNCNTGATAPRKTMLVPKRLQAAR